MYSLRNTNNARSRLEPIKATMGAFLSPAQSEQERTLAQASCRLHREVRSYCAHLIRLRETRSLEELEELCANVTGRSSSGASSASGSGSGSSVSSVSSSSNSNSSGTSSICGVRQTVSEFLLLKVRYPVLLQTEVTWPELKRLEYVMMDSLHGLKRIQALSDCRSRFAHCTHTSQSIYGTLKRRMRQLVYLCSLHDSFVRRLLARLPDDGAS